MSAAKRRLGRRARIVLSAGAYIGAVAGFGVGLAGCAGHHHISEAPPHPIAVEVQNNITVPTELTVFVTQDQGGARQMLGTVPGAQTKTSPSRRFRGASPIDWRAGTPLGHSVCSPRFKSTTRDWHRHVGRHAKPGPVLQHCDRHGRHEASERQHEALRGETLDVRRWTLETNREGQLSATRGWPSRFVFQRPAQRLRLLASRS